MPQLQQKKPSPAAAQLAPISKEEQSLVDAAKALKESLPVNPVTAELGKARFGERGLIPETLKDPVYAPTHASAREYVSRVAERKINDTLTNPPKPFDGGDYEKFAEQFKDTEDRLRQLYEPKQDAAYFVKTRSTDIRTHFESELARTKGLEKVGGQRGADAKAASAWLTSALKSDDVLLRLTALLGQEAAAAR